MRFQLQVANRRSLQPVRTIKTLDIDQPKLVLPIPITLNVIKHDAKLFAAFGGDLHIAASLGDDQLLWVVHEEHRHFTEEINPS